MSEPATPTIDLSAIIQTLNQMLPTIFQVLMYSMVIGLVFKSLIPSLVDAFKTPPI